MLGIVLNALYMLFSLSLTNSSARQTLLYFYSKDEEKLSSLLKNYRQSTVEPRSKLSQSGCRVYILNHNNLRTSKLIV